MNPETVFFNHSKRLRSGWRFLVFQLLIIFFGWFSEKGFELLLKINPNLDENSLLFRFLLPNFILLVLAVLCGWLCGKFLEDLPFRALGAAFTKNWLKDLSIGLILGAVSILLAVLIAAAFGGLKLEFNQTATTGAILQTLIVALAIFLIGGAAEEAYFRGYILQTFARAHLAWMAIVFTSLYFAFAHSNNPNVSFYAQLNTALAGIWFGMAYLKTRNLWFPFGIHFAWNWIQGAILGIPVSGLTDITSAPLFLETERGREVLTGGNYGIEGGIACTIAIVLSCLLIYFLPFPKPTEEMLALTSGETVKTEN